jgi:hypothetical protein
MSAVRKFRFTILIGAGVMAAGTLVYMTNSRISLRHTQGAIGKREVYRDSQVEAADVKATPGTAPVAGKVLLESKEFKALAKNQAFHELMTNQSFLALAQNAQFVALLQNANFLQMVQNPVFAELLTNGTLSAIATNIQSELISQGNAAGLQGSAQFSQQTLTALAGNNAQSLSTNGAFLNLMYNASFLSFVSTQSNSQALANLTTGAFPGLVASSSFQGLLNQSSFLAVVQSGSAAGLFASAVQ